MSCFCKYLLFKIENIEVFIFFKFSDESNIYCVIKTCSQFNVSVSSMKSFFSFAKNMNVHIWGLQMTCQHFSMKYSESIFGNSIHDRLTQKRTLWLGFGNPNIFVKCWPCCQETQQVGFGTLINFETICMRYFADKILGDSH